MGLFEIHCHTSESSICGKVAAKEVVRLHKEAGFEGVCITDHYNDYHFRNRFYDDAENYLKGYRLAKEYGEKVGLKVFFGVEYRFSDTHNDYLLFGVEEDFVIKNSTAFNMTLKEFRRNLIDDNMLLIQAHPMRDGMKLVNTSLLDGIEAVNGNERHNPRNDKVRIYAEGKGLVMTAASDFHRPGDIYKAAMNFENSIDSVQELVEEIKAGRYSLIDNTMWNTQHKGGTGL